MRPRALTGAKLERFKALCQANQPNQIIQQELGISRFTVNRYRKDLQLPAPSKSRLTEDVVQSILLSPDSAKKLAKLFRVGERTIRQLRDTHQPKPKFTCLVCGTRALVPVHERCRYRTLFARERHFWIK